jgi:hypothetical protein
MGSEVLLYSLFVSVESGIKNRIKFGTRGGGGRNLGHSGERKRAIIAEAAEGHRTSATAVVQ